LADRGEGFGGVTATGNGECRQNVATNRNNLKMLTVYRVG
jgi:hypothetical protein